MQERSEALLQKVKKVAPAYRTRPSLVAPVSSAAAFSLGAVSAALPQNLRNAVSGMTSALRVLSGAGLRETIGLWLGSCCQSRAVTCLWAVAEPTGNSARLALQRTGSYPGCP